ncbi:uncharacterized protein LOC124168226 [Ischnura elegans]|uniref:uncharacterized protein LOC124168226 n=1 Tax=Ischnura elegans TaxID=197161 RepID=UPI001ED89A99|nr:uncharacterized protein LOC124168226 [Ischnura elegans]
MDVAGNVSLGTPVETFPMDGKIFAGVYLHEKNNSAGKPKHHEDAELAIKCFRKLGCKIIGDVYDEGGASSVDDEELVIFNQKLTETEDSLEKFSTKNPDACCYILYFIVPQEGSKFKTSDNYLDVIRLRETIKNPETPVIFFIQDISSSVSPRPSMLLNTDKKDGGELKIPRSANVLVAYLPNPENLGVSVIKILTDELSKNLSIHNCLTNFNRVLIEKGCKPTPRFGSTLIHQLYLQNGESAKLPEEYSCKRKYLAYAFLFGKFSEEREEKLSDLSNLIEKDTESLKVLNHFGVELQFCVNDGRMTTEEFKKKLREILESGDLDSCDGIFIIVSSHGNENLTVYTYDGEFTIDFIRGELAKCAKLKDKPKVIIGDACRGGDQEKSVSCNEVGHTLHTKDPRDATEGQKSGTTAGMYMNCCSIDMDDIIIALAAVEGKIAIPTPEHGSIFIYHLCQMIREYNKLDFLSILTLTMNKVSIRGTAGKQQVTFTSGLRKLLYFPKCEEQIMEYE